MHSYIAFQRSTWSVGWQLTPPVNASCCAVLWCAAAQCWGMPKHTCGPGCVPNRVSQPVRALAQPPLCAPGHRDKHICKHMLETASHAAISEEQVRRVDQPACVGPGCDMHPRLLCSTNQSVTVLTLVLVYDMLLWAFSAQHTLCPNSCCRTTFKHQPTWQPQTCIPQLTQCTVVPSAIHSRRAFIQAQQQHLGRHHTGHAPQQQSQ